MASHILAWLACGSMWTALAVLAADIDNYQKACAEEHAIAQPTPHAFWLAPMSAAGHAATQ